MPDGEIFLIDVEVKILSDSDLYEDGYDIGFAYGFVSATSVDEAMKKLHDELSRLRCRAIRVGAVYPYAGTEWQSKKQKKEFDGYADEARRADQLIFSPFLTCPEQ